MLVLEPLLEPLDRAALRQRETVLEQRVARVDLVLRRRRAGLGAQVGPLLRLARDAGVDRRPLGLRRVRAEDLVRRRGEHTRPERHEVRAAGRQYAEPLAVGVAGSALPSEADEALRG